MVTTALPPGAYRTPARSVEGELREKGSRFRAFVVAVEDEDAARAELDRLARQYPDATHHCWAWRLGPEPRERSSDAGEPAGTAGRPILRVLAGAGLSDALAVVVRWYGGTKLGKGGLARAYAAAVREAVGDLPVVTRVPARRVVVEAPYAAVGAIKRLVRPPEVTLVDESYGTTARLVLEIGDHLRSELESALADLGVDWRDR